MGLFDFLHKKTDERIIDVEVAVEESFIEQAQKAAMLVDESVKKGDFSEVSNKLRGYTYNGKERAVFDYTSIIPWILLMLLGIICSIGFMCFLPFAAGIIAYSVEYRLYGMYITAIIVAVVMFNALLCAKAVQEIRFSRRYDHYKNILKYRNIEIVEDLAEMIEVKSKIVEKDLKRAVRTKLIPQGHFGKDNLFFIVTDEVFARYSKSKAAYDRYFKKMMEDRSRMKIRTKETEELLAQGEEYIGKIRDSNDIIKDREVSAKLDQMERVVSAIFHEVDINPAQANKLGVFVNYYLPTTEKLLESYMEIDEKQVKGKSLQKTQRDITQALDSINNAFESLLERFYEEQELDVASDISAMGIIMKQEGLQTDTDTAADENEMEESESRTFAPEKSDKLEDLSVEIPVEKQDVVEERKKAVKKAVISPVPYTYVELPKRKMDTAEYTAKDNRGEIEKLLLVILQAEGPILKGVLIRKIITSFGVKRNAAVLEATENALKNVKAKTSKHKGSVFCWAPNQDPDSYSGLRATKDRSGVEICPQELSNAAVYVLQEEGELSKDNLIMKVSAVLGYKKLSKNLESALTEGIEFARSSGEIIYVGGMFKLP